MVLYLLIIVNKISGGNTDNGSRFPRNKYFFIKEISMTTEITFESLIFESEMSSGKTYYLGG